MKQSPNKIKKPRVQSAALHVCRTKVAMYWWPLPYDKKDRFIPSSVDCLYNQEYFERGEAMLMLRAL
jgi:hypothetical protein